MFLCICCTVCNRIVWMYPNDVAVVDLIAGNEFSIMMITLHSAVGKSMGGRIFLYFPHNFGIIEVKIYL